MCSRVHERRVVQPYNILLCRTMTLSHTTKAPLPTRVRRPRELSGDSRSLHAAASRAPQAPRAWLNATASVRGLPRSRRRPRSAGPRRRPRWTAPRRRNGRPAAVTPWGGELPLHPTPPSSPWAHSARRLSPTSDASGSTYCDDPQSLPTRPRGLGLRLLGPRTNGAHHAQQSEQSAPHHTCSGSGTTGLQRMRIFMKMA